MGPAIAGRFGVASSGGVVGDIMGATREIVARGTYFMGSSGWGVTRLWAGGDVDAGAMSPHACSWRWQ
jgi:hypothetical protein